MVLVTQYSFEFSSSYLSGVFFASSSFTVSQSSVLGPLLTFSLSLSNLISSVASVTVYPYAVDTHLFCISSSDTFSWHPDPYSHSLLSAVSLSIVNPCLKNEMENSRSKFISCNLHAVVSSMMKSCATPLRTWIIPLSVIPMLYMLPAHSFLRY